MNGAPVKPLAAPAPAAVSPATVPAPAAPATDDLTAPDPDVGAFAVPPAATKPSAPAPVAQMPLPAEGQGADAQGEAAAGDATLAADAAYDAAFAKLTPPQKTTLEDLDKKFLETLRPLVQVFKVGAGLEFCLSTGHALMGEDSRYIPAFKLFKEEQDETQAALWDAHHGELEKVTFMPPDVLEAHFQSLADTARAAAQQMVEDGGKTGAFDKTDCAQIQNILANAVAKARAALPKPPETAKKTGGQGTYAPPKR